MLRKLKYRSCVGSRSNTKLLLAPGANTGIVPLADAQAQDAVSAVRAHRQVLTSG
jgi:hypothetical protein